MKNFDMNIYEKTCSSMFTDVLEWNEMCKRCYEEYKICSSHFTESFRDWYEKDFFHDSILEGVTPTFDEWGKWTVTIFLKGWVYNEPVRWILQYKGVSSFSVHKDSDFRSRCKEECLYGEFYRSEHDEGRVIHEFFTDKETFFYIEFEKLIFTEHKPLSFLSTQTKKRRCWFHPFSKKQ